MNAEFFDPPFWNEAAGKDPHPRLAWRTQLRTIAGEVFERAADAAPSTEVKRVRARAQARSFLDGQMHKWLKDVQHGE